jgi:hypothetical protein
MVGSIRNFLMARRVYVFAKEKTEAKDRQFEKENPIPEDASGDFIEDWSMRSIDHSDKEWRKLEEAENEFIKATKRCLQLQQPERWDEVKELFEDKVNLILAKSDIIKLALRMAV